MTTAISPAELSDAIHMLHTEGVPAVLEAWPQLRGYRLQLQQLEELQDDHEALDQVLARMAGRIEEAEAALARSVLQQQEVA